MSAAIAEFDGTNPATVSRMLNAGEPAVLRGAALDWPVVAAARAGDEAVLAYLASVLTGEIDLVEAAPGQHGRFHYAADLREFNFQRQRMTATAFLAALAHEAKVADPRALAAQGVLARQAAPGFESANPLPLKPHRGEVRLWIGNRAQVAAHSDPADNLAYCAAGQRRFTLFAPEQVGNLYLGPFEPTPAGTPIAMTDPLAPDFARYPRFAAAMDSALVADLAPGDAIFIPYGWYHHVQALSAVSVLVNCWWNEDTDEAGSPWDLLLHAMLALRPLSPRARRHWAAMIRHYGLEPDGPAGEHLPSDSRGVLDARSPRDLQAMRQLLLRNLSRNGLPPDRQ